MSVLLSNPRPLDTMSERPLLRVVVQVPCLNEAGTLPATLESLKAVEVPGCSINLLLIDDGSTDKTVDVAEAAGVDRVVSHTCNRGLAAAFTTGLDACLQMGADMIVNTDGDGQYSASEIPRLIEPILAGRADLVIGDRRPGDDGRASWLKRKLQRFGSWTVSRLAGLDILDAVSGFRAMTREAAIKMHVVTGFSYTIETVLQASSKGLAIEFVPITTNTVTRPSRLFRSIPQFVFRSGLTMLRVAFMFRPLAVLSTISAILALIGIIPIGRFLILWSAGDGAGHIQSLVLGGALMVLAGIVAVAALLADLMASNRKLLEMTLEKVKRMEAEADIISNVGRVQERSDAAPAS